MENAVPPAPTDELNDSWFGHKPHPSQRADLPPGVRLAGAAPKAPASPRAQPDDDLLNDPWFR